MLSTIEAMPVAGGVAACGVPRMTRCYHRRVDDELTQLRVAWRQGDTSARDRVVGAVYPQLRAIADRQLAGERRSHTLQPTALVNEAWLRLAGLDRDLRLLQGCATGGQQALRLVRCLRHRGQRRRRVGGLQRGQQSAGCGDGLRGLVRTLTGLRQGGGQVGLNSAA